MSENTTPEVIEGEGVSEETPKVKLIDRIGRKGKIALGAVEVGHGVGAAAPVVAQALLVGAAYGQAQVAGLYGQDQTGH